MKILDVRWGANNKNPHNVKIDREIQMWVLWGMRGWYGEK